LLKKQQLVAPALLFLELKMFILESGKRSIVWSLLAPLHLNILVRFKIILKTLGNLNDFQRWVQSRSIENLENFKISFEARLLGQLFFRAA
jgi:hypothetical protein